MSPLHAAAIVGAGVAAGTINTIVGSGSLITFPTLLALGYPALPANISNNIGLVPGGASGAWGYRHELHGMAPWLRRLVPASLLGGLLGATLLLVLPASAFRAVVPVLVAVALVLVVVQPRLAARAAARRAAAAEAGRAAPEHRGVMTTGVFGAGVYGGYFGAAQGVLVLGLLGGLLPESMQRLNALKNVLSTVVNATAAVTFAAVAWHRIDWAVVGLIAVGSIIGGQVGARVGRRLSPVALRWVIVVVGVVAIVRLVTT